MKLLLTLMKLYIPESVKRRMLTDVFEVTADAFRVAVPSMDRLTSEDILKQYASFTSEKAAAAIRERKELETGRRLYSNALKLGQRTRQDLQVNRMKDVMGVGRIVYKVLGIDFNGDESGEVLIRRCYFSRFYSPGICRLVSALDEGFLMGLSGGKKLEFAQRITDHDECCRAHLSIAGRK